MKKILFIALSAVGIGGSLFAWLRKSNAQRSKVDADASSGSDERRVAERSQRQRAANALGMTVNSDGSLDVRSSTRKRTAKSPAPVIHVKKDGSPDKRFKENRSLD